jgi:hypothetical protein
MNFAPCTIPPAIELARIINKYWCKLFATGALFVLVELCDKSDLQTQSKAEGIFGLFRGSGAEKAGDGKQVLLPSLRLMAGNFVAPALLLIRAKT